MEFLIVLAILAAVVAVVTSPLWRRRRAEVPSQRSLDSELAELEAAREAKYREIRDADLDHRTGKLSDADWRAQDRALRAEAVELLRRLDRLP